MANLNTTPRTWVAGEKVTASEMNVEVRDAFTEIQDVWDTFTPALSTPSASFVVGNGTITGAFYRTGHTWHIRWNVIWGSTSSIGTGLWRLTLPSGCVPAMGRYPTYQCDLYDSSVDTDFAGFALYKSSTGLVHILCDPTTAGNAVRNVTQTVPMTWATSDVLQVAATFEGI